MNANSVGSPRSAEAASAGAALRRSRMREGGAPPRSRSNGRGDRAAEAQGAGQCLRLPPPHLRLAIQGRSALDLAAAATPRSRTIAHSRSASAPAATSSCQPSTYGTENAPTLDAVAAFGPTARAVVVVDTSVTDAELKRMHEQGARGIRFNLAQAGATTPEMIEPLSKRINELGWHIQINAVGGDDPGDHADPGECAVADRVRSPRAYSAAGRRQPSAVRSSAGADRQGKDLGQAVGRLCRHESRAADLCRRDRGGAGLREGTRPSAASGAATGRIRGCRDLRTEARRRRAVRPAARLGAGREPAAPHPGREPGGALRFSRRMPDLSSEVR